MVADSLIRDFRYGIRTLARTPGFSLIAVVVMALGIGATAALFTVVDSVLLKPLPLPDADRLVMIYEADTKLKFNNNVVAGGTFHSWEQGNRTFGLAASAAITHLIRSQLYGTQPLDPLVLALVAVALLAVAAAACLVPAWRASRLDPMEALRTE